MRAGGEHVDEDRRHALTTALLACGVVGGPGFLVVALVAGARRLDYLPLHQPVSMLSLGTAGWVQIANFIVTGLLMIACAAGLRRAIRSGPGATWGPLLIGIYGFGLLAAGVFTADPSYGYPPGAALGPASSPTLEGRLHDLAGFVVFGPLTVASFVLARRFAWSRRRAWTVISLFAGLAMPAFIAAAFHAWASGGAMNFGGVFQRLAVATGWVWVGSLALDTILNRR
jgi:hypothetical protein